MYLNYESSTAQKHIINLDNVIVYSHALSVVFISGYPSTVNMRRVINIEES